MQVVGVYARLSKLNGRDENIDTQLKLGRDLAEARHPGCQVIEYKDPDASAESEDVYRPDYEQLKADLLSGKVTQVCTSDQERLTRRPDELERLITVFRTAGVPGFWGYRDGWTSMAPGQSAGARYKGVGAKEYVEGIKVKVNEKLDALAKAGRPGPGTSFGYRNVRDGRDRATLVVVPEEAAAARWAAEMLLSGWTLMAVADTFNEQGVPLRRGGKVWTPSRVRGMLRAPTIAGKRVHRGEIVGDGEWEPILDEMSWRRIVALFDSRTRSRPARQYLLTGLAVCGECDAWRLKAMAQKQRQDRRRRVYSCHKATGGCGRVHAASGSLERYVVDVMFRHLNSAALRSRIAAGDPYAPVRKRIVAALTEIEDDRRALAARRGRREIEDDEWDIAREALAADRARLSAELAAVPTSVLSVDPDAVLTAWDEMTFDERRHGMRLFIGRVVVSRATRRGPVFDKGRVAVFDTAGERIDV